jgi:Putative transposase
LQDVARAFVHPGFSTLAFQDIGSNRTFAAAPDFHTMSYLNLPCKAHDDLSHRGGRLRQMLKHSLCSSRLEQARARPHGLTPWIHAAQTLHRFAADPAHLGAEIGFLTVLHTWGQSLMHHPHLHCLVPGGGISPDGNRWVACRSGFFLPVRVLSRLFRGLFLHELEKAFTAGRLRFLSALLPLQERAAFLHHLAPARKAEWVVFAKRPFAGPQQVLFYVGRYTHRIAIANSRLLSIDDGRVRFRWNDYRRGNPHSAMSLTADEFIRRFLIHVLPDSFHRIRYFGFLCNHQRERKLARCRELLGMVPPDPAEPRSAMPADYRLLHQSLTGTSLTSCPTCGRGHI